jgi:hypothetical protein
MSSVGVVQRADARQRRHDLSQQVQALHLQLGRQALGAGHVAARACQTGNEAGGHRAVGTQHDDRNRAGRLLGGKGMQAPVGDDDVDLGAYEIGGLLARAIRPRLRRADLEHRVPALDVAELSQRLVDRTRVVGAEEADAEWAGRLCVDHQQRQCQHQRQSECAGQ